MGMCLVSWEATSRRFMPGTSESLILKNKLQPSRLNEERVARPRLLGTLRENRTITSQQLRCTALVVAMVIPVAAGTVWAQDEVPASGAPAEMTIDQLESRSWGLDDGLPSAEVFDLLQTRDGYLWVATAGGLARFDGIRFEVFDRANTPGLEVGQDSHTLRKPRRHALGRERGRRADGVSPGTASEGGTHRGIGGVDGPGADGGSRRSVVGGYERRSVAIPGTGRLFRTGGGGAAGSDGHGGGCARHSLARRSRGTGAARGRRV